MPQPMDAQVVWAKIKQEALAKLEFNLVLADALNAVVPVTVDGNLLVLGFAQGGMHHAGILQGPDKKNLIERVLRQESGAPMTHQFIDGTTLQDWEFVKARQQRASAHTEAGFSERKQQSSASASVDELIQELHRRYNAVEGRGFPQMKAKWLLDLIPSLVNLEEKLKGNDELFYRQYARVIDKVASLLDIPAVVIALELEKYKRSRGS